MSADRLGVRRRLLVVLLAPFFIAGCNDWFTTFIEQPAIHAFESPVDDTILPPRSNPQYSIPITGELVPAYVVSYEPLPATVDSMSGLSNPVPPTAPSVLNGRRYYQINCAVCHGPGGSGIGPATQFGIPPISLVSPRARDQLTDGYIYGMIRNGRGIMPSYARIEEYARWDVVNYIRALQGVVSIPVDTLPLGPPGVTGAAVPGATATAPTVPAPFYAPARRGVPEAPAGAHGELTPPSPAPGGGVH